MTTRYTYGIRSNGLGRFFAMRFAIRDGRRDAAGEVISDGALTRDEALDIVNGMLIRERDIARQSSTPPLT